MVASIILSCVLIVRTSSSGVPEALFGSSFLIGSWDSLLMQLVDWLNCSNCSFELISCLITWFLATFWSAFSFFFLLVVKFCWDLLLCAVWQGIVFTCNEFLLSCVSFINACYFSYSLFMSFVFSCPFSFWRLFYEVFCLIWYYFDSDMFVTIRWELSCFLMGFWAMIGACDTISWGNWASMNLFCFLKLSAYCCFGVAILSLLGFWLLFILWFFLCLVFFLVFEFGATNSDFSLDESLTLVVVSVFQ